MLSLIFNSVLFKKKNISYMVMVSNNRNSNRDYDDCLGIDMQMQPFEFYLPTDFSNLAFHGTIRH